MSTPVIVMLIILVILIAACIALYFFGKKAEKRQAEQEEQMASVAQTMSMLIIDKKRMKLKEAGLPAVVIENTPKYLRRTKVPVVKAKVGPKVMTLMCDAKVFEVLPVKKEAKVVVSGIYITGIKSDLHNRNQERTRRIDPGTREKEKRSAVTFQKRLTGFII